MWEREDASARHKFAIIQPRGDSRLQDPQLLVGKAPSLDKFSLSERKRSAVEVYTFECALRSEWWEPKERAFSPSPSPDLPNSSGAERLL